MADFAASAADGYSREDEPEAARLDRNWAELLQELRVTQAGSQILTGFLLTIPFQSGFDRLDAEQIIIYLTLVAFAALATILSLTPVIVHRGLFRQGARRRLVGLADVLLRLTFGTLGLTVAGASLLIFDVVVGRAAGIAACIVTLLLAAAAWLVLPLTVRKAHNDG